MFCDIVNFANSAYVSGLYTGHGFGYIVDLGSFHSPLDCERRRSGVVCPPFVALSFFCYCYLFCT